MKLFKCIRNYFKKEKVVIPMEQPLPPINEIPTEEETSLFPYLKDKAHGIDISHHNSRVIFGEVKQDFIYMKATEGSSFVSSVHSSRMYQAIDKDIPCGSYHYYKPKVDPLVQAKHFCKNLMGNMNPVLDLEDPYDNREDLIKDIQIFLDYVEKHTGKIPVIYTGYSYIKTLNLPASFARYPLWLAWYTTSDRVKAPLPWKNWTFWQYSESAIVDGVGKCDVNWYNKLGE